ncbi:hypothetical protein F5Y18DRAFT_429092 [Xylariaceae sp. FL1019]|nr:hypothetical protein F5Y18DRAFT_429092 [Xylariaceae sp. FL1019]
MTQEGKKTDRNEDWSYDGPVLHSFYTAKASLIFHAVVAIFFTIVWMMVHHASIPSQPFGAKLLHSPARGAISFETTEFNHSLFHLSPFQKPPGSEVDEVWNELLQHSVSAVKPTELSSSATTITDETGQSIVMLDVFRSLHCMNSIRKYFYKGFYGDEAPDSNELNLCVDQVLQSLKCHMDIAIGSYEWKEGHSKPWPNFGIKRECHRWDDINRWASRHRATRERQLSV